MVCIKLYKVPFHTELLAIAMQKCVERQIFAKEWVEYLFP